MKKGSEIIALFDTWREGGREENLRSGAQKPFVVVFRDALDRESPRV